MSKVEGWYYVRHQGRVLKGEFEEMDEGLPTLRVMSANLRQIGVGIVHREWVYEKASKAVQAEAARLSDEAAQMEAAAEQMREKAARVESVARQLEQEEGGC